MPPRNALLWPQTEDEVLPRQAVKIEAAKAKDGVIKPVLKRYDGFGECIIWKHASVVCGKETFKESMANGKERKMLDIRIMVRLICDNMVNLHEVSVIHYYVVYVVS